MRIFKGLQRFVDSRAGGIAMLTALSMPFLIGGTGLASDTIQWTYIKRAMQRQADSGALAGAFALAQQRAVSSTVTADLARNNNVAQTVAPIIENAPTAGAFQGNARAVRVVLATDVSMPFVSIVMGGPIRISAEATSQVVAQGQYCVISLETTDRTGISMGGSTSVNLGCGMMTNSPAADAITAGGSSTVNATPIAAVGGLPTSNNYATGTQLIPYSVPQFDPLIGLPNPLITNSSSNANVGPNQSRTLSPGVYSGMDLKGTVTLNPGVYYIDGGVFSVGAQGVVTGDGVTIILSSRTAASNPASIATVSMNGGATVKLTAPATGTYAGVIFYQDRRALDSSTNTINGNSSSKYQGTLYFPNQEVYFTGNSSMNANCLQIVARRASFSGSSTISNVCPPNSGASSFSGTRVKLVA